MNPLLALFTPLFRGRRVVFPIPSKEDRRVMATITEMLGSGAFTPVIHRRYPLDGIVEANRYVECGRKVGNVVITVSSGA